MTVAATRYHWALLVGPKDEVENDRGIRCHVKETMVDGKSSWYFEERDVPVAPTAMLLVRVLIAKVGNREKLLEILRNTPVKEGEAGWNCVKWVKEALEKLAADKKALGTSTVEWKKVRDRAMKYCQEKKDDHRFDGKAPEGKFDMNKAPTYDMLQDKETII